MLLPLIVVIIIISKNKSLNFHNVYLECLKNDAPKTVFLFVCSGQVSCPGISVLLSPLLFKNCSKNHSIAKSAGKEDLRILHSLWFCIIRVLLTHLVPDYSHKDQFRQAFCLFSYFAWMPNMFLATKSSFFSLQSIKRIMYHPCGFSINCLFIFLIYKDSAKRFSDFRKLAWSSSWSWGQEAAM